MKKIKILFWKLLQWYNDQMINWSLNDLKLFEKRSLIVEKHLKNLGVINNEDLDNFDIDEDTVVMLDEIQFITKINNLNSIKRAKYRLLRKAGFSIINSYKYRSYNKDFVNSLIRNVDVIKRYKTRSSRIKMISKLEDEMEFNNKFSKGFSGGHTILDPKNYINKRFGIKGDNKND